jgi:heat shock protein HtpX
MMSTRQPSILRHRLRIVALTAVLLAFDVALVAAVYVLGHVVIWLLPLMSFQFHAMIWPPAFDLVPLWLVLAVGTPLTLVIQSVFGYRLTLRDVTSGEIGPDKSLKNIVLADRSDDDDEEDAALEVTEPPADHPLYERVSRLAQTADIAPPTVRLVHTETPNSYVASRPGEQTLFVTAGLLDVLEGEELDAVLAHELAHLKNGDAFVMTAAAFLPTVTEQYLARVAGALRHSWVLGLVWDLDRDETISAPQVEIPLLVFALVSIPIASVLYLTSTTCYRLLSRIREYAADAGGVAISGSPAALARALETLTTDLRPETDLRTAETGVRELCVLPYALEAAESEIPDDALGRLQNRWDRFCTQLLPGSHPEPEDRITALREQQARLEG